MNKPGRLVVCVFLLVKCYSGFCQEANQPGANPNVQVIPPSPNAASLMAYAEVPVSKYTGVPSIDIPIYTIKSGTLSVPVSISYHAGGIKVSQEASVVGLGWALNAGGMISRSIRGCNDLGENSGCLGYPAAQALPPSTESNQIDVNNDATTFEAYRRILKSQEDTQADLFFYNFSGYSGKFYIEKGQDINGIVKATLIEQNNLVIELDYQQRKWVITDGNGVKYYFETTEKSYTVTYDLPGGGGIGAPDDFNLESNETGDEDRTTNSWYLDKIQSPNGDVISFGYSKPDEDGAGYFYRGIQSQASKVQTFYKRTAVGSWDAATKVGLPVSANYTSYSKTVTGEVTLSSIVFKEGWISFDPDFTRRDIRRYVDYQPRMLGSVGIFTTNNGLVTRVDFKYGYFNSGMDDPECKYLRLKLESVQFSSPGQEKLNPYVFTYNESVQLPSKLSTSIDHWGFYNGAGNGRNLFPAKAFNRQELIFEHGVDRETHPYDLQAGVLKEIKYPSGYTAKFDFEPNDFSNITPEPVFDHVTKFAEACKDESCTVSNSFSYVDFYVNEKSIVTIEGYSTSESIACGDTEDLPTSEDIYGWIVPTAGPGDMTDYTSLLDYIELGPPALASFSYNGVYRSQGGSTVIYPMCWSGPDPLAERKMSFELQPGWYRVVNEPYQGFTSTVVVDYEIRTGTAYNKTGGGLRVNRITADDSGNKMTKRYLYSRVQDNITYSTGRIMSKPFYHHQRAVTKTDQVLETCSGGDCYISYQVSALYQIVESNSWSPLSSSAQGSFVGYDQVTELFGDNGENGKKVYQFKNQADYTDLDIKNLPSYPQLDNGQLISETTFNAGGDMLREVSNFYQEDNVKVVKGMGFETLPFLYPSGPVAEPEFASQYFVKFYDVPSKWLKLWKTVTKDHAAGNVLVNETEYRYNSLNKLVSHEIRTQSDGKKLITRSKYATDYAASAENGIFSEMTAQNIVGPAIESQLWEQLPDGTKKLLSSTITEYAHFNGDPVNGTPGSFIYPSKINTLKTALPLTTAQFGGETPDNTGPFSTLFFNKARYQLQQELKYDTKGNIIRYVQPGNQETGFLWGYNNALPVARAMNAAENEILFNGFEFTPGATTGAAHTGRRYWNGDFTVNFTAPNARSYKISYWYLESGVWKFSGVLDYNVASMALTPGDAIDDVRIFPAGSRMTTYTYDPLVGMTSVTDENNVPAFYDYDGLNRLIAVKDQRGNFLKSYEYHYRISQE